MTVSVERLSFTAFVQSVLRVELTLGQRVVGRVAYDGVDPGDLSGEERERAAEIFGDVDIIPAAARHVFVGVCGARAGKSYILGALRALHLALTVPLTALAPGELAAGIIVAPDLRLARQTLRYVLGAAKATPSIARRIVSETADSFVIRRPDGAQVEIVCLPASRGGSALRGRSLVFALLDESAFFRDESYTVNDVEIVKAVAPRIVAGGQLLILSTPWLEQGVLYELHRDNYADPKTCIVAHAPTLLLRDDAHTRSYVEREHQRDPENAPREFEAKFIGGGAGVFLEPASIGQAVDPARPLVMTAPAGAVIGFGADLGLISNSSALVGVALVGETFEVLEIVERKPTKGTPLKLSSVITDDFAPVLARHGAKRFLADGHIREPAREYTDSLGISIVAAPEGSEGKLATYLLVQKAFREGRIKMPRHQRLESQLRAIVSRPLPGGGVRISSPRRPDGSHGDVASAFVLAIFAAWEARAPRRAHGSNFVVRSFESTPIGYYDGQDA